MERAVMHPRLSMQTPNLRRLQKKWGGYLVDAVRTGNAQQAENWQEAIIAAEAIIQRRESPRAPKR